MVRRDPSFWAYRFPPSPENAATGHVPPLLPFPQQKPSEDRPPGMSPRRLGGHIRVHHAFHGRPLARPSTLFRDVHIATSRRYALRLPSGRRGKSRFRNFLHVIPGIPLRVPTRAIYRASGQWQELEAERSFDRRMRPVQEAELGVRLRNKRRR